MWVRRNVRVANRSSKHALLRESPSLKRHEDLKGCALEIFTEPVDPGSLASAMVPTSYLMENLQGILEEAYPSTNPRRSCPLSSFDFEE